MLQLLRLGLTPSNLVEKKGEKRKGEGETKKKIKEKREREREKKEVGPFSTADTIYYIYVCKEGKAEVQNILPLVH